MKICLNAKTVQQLRCVRFCLPAIHLRELAFQFAGTDSILIGEILLGIDRFFLLHDFIKAGIAHDHRIHNGIGIIFKMILLQKGKPLSRRDGNVALGGFQLP